MHGQRSAIFLRDDWACKFEEEGCQRNLYQRVTSVQVGKFHLISCYQPVWNTNENEMTTYRENLAECMLNVSNDKILIMGGDFNAQIGKAEERQATNSCGEYGIGRTTAAGRDLINWMEGNGLCWINSFFRESKRVTWFNRANKTWHELDGFICESRKRSRIVGGMKTIQDTCFENLSDHKPKLMTLSINIHKHIKTLLRLSRLEKFN